MPQEYYPIPTSTLAKASAFGDNTFELNPNKPNPFQMDDVVEISDCHPVCSLDRRDIGLVVRVVDHAITLRLLQPSKAGTEYGFHAHPKGATVTTLSRAVPKEMQFEVTYG